jgi:hypothetical protein
MDGNGDGEVSREEFVAGFGVWFRAWDIQRIGTLSEAQLKAGIERDLFNYRSAPRRVERIREGT